jgi:Carboxylesterase type B
MSESVVVRVTQGDLRGRKIITKSGLQYYSFQGIPYATPPVGNLRFKVSIFILCKKKTVLAEPSDFIPICRLRI